MKTGSARMNTDTGKMNPLVAEVATPLDVISNENEPVDAVQIVQAVQVVDSSPYVSRSGAAAEEEGDGNEPANISAEKSAILAGNGGTQPPPQDLNKASALVSQAERLASSAPPAAADMNDKSSAQVCRSCCVKLSGFKYSLTSLVKHRCRSCGLMVCMSCSPTKEAVDGFPVPQRVCTLCVDGRAIKISALATSATSILTSASADASSARNHEIVASLQRKLNNLVNETSPMFTIATDNFPIKTKVVASVTKGGAKTKVADTIGKVTGICRMETLACASRRVQQRLNWRC